MKKLNYFIALLLCTGISAPAFSQADDVGINKAFLNMLNPVPDFTDSLTLLHYTQITQKQANNSPMTFGVLAENYGTNPAANVKLIATVSGAATYSDSSSASTIPAGDSLHLQITNSTFTPTVVGTYDINLRVNMAAVDLDPGNDSIAPGVPGASTFDVTDTVWARDINQQLGAFYFGPGFAYEVGNLFTVNVLDTATSISVHFASNNTAGKLVQFHIYDDPYTTIPTPLASSDFYVLTANDIGAWVTLRFDSGTILDINNHAIMSPGQYLVGVETFDDPTYVSKGQISGVPDGIVLSDPDGFDQWFNTTTGVPKIRLNLGSRYVTVGMEENELETAVSIFPNPSTGVCTVQGTTGSVEVYDVMGHLLLRSSMHEIDLSGHAEGVYLVKTGEAVRKVVLH